MAFPAPANQKIADAIRRVLDKGPDWTIDDLIGAIYDGISAAEAEALQNAIRESAEEMWTDQQIAAILGFLTLIKGDEVTDRLIKYWIQTPGDAAD